ncbi:TetR/AcrR family transcriptional regulator [Nocardia panacis]|uniref:TetR/AcrR family transcriptional regulator n=1 Tax=Nocardia panacis TaxID=2340916 RepID=A0A3A4KKR3_9NOCA|nr:TetR/AcrR family transcriptional regulator [Nocardia panacis]RJO75301.1 TetR/AcrR family transcriptional regulator [Nocardia panacis]
MDVADSLRERLVTSGVELLEQVGVGQLGLRAIARHAGVSHGAPRRHFPTHAALLAAIAARGFAALETDFAAAPAHPPRARAEYTALAYVRFATDHPEMFMLMFRHDLLEGSGQNLRRTSLPMFERWSTMIAECAPASADRAALLAWTSLHGIAALAANRSLALISPDTNPIDLVAEVIDTFVGSA